LALVLLAQVLPNAVLLLVGGVAGDRWRRNVVMVASSFASFAAEGTIAAGFVFHFATIWFLMVFAGINGTASAFYSPAASGILINLVPRSELTRANSVLRIGVSSTKAIGPAVAGVLFVVVGPGVLIAWDSITFLAAGLLLFGLNVPARNTAREGFRESLFRGWERFRSEVWLWSCASGMALGGMAWVAGFQLLGPVITKDRGLDSSFWGLVVSSYAIGLVVGGVVNLHWHPRRILVAANLASLLLCIPLAGLAGGWPEPIVLLGAACAGIGTDIGMIAWAVAKQVHVAAEEQARVSSFDQLAGICLAPLAYPMAGFLAAELGPSDIIAGSALLIFVVSVGVLTIPGVRNLSGVVLAIAITSGSHLNRCRLRGVLG
jgi:MFS family permease